MTDPIRTTTSTAPQGDGRRPLAGSWRVDPRVSYARFVARTAGGLIRTPGAFGSLSGGLELGDDRIAGALVIGTGSIDTGNRLRDRHLRSSAFFNVDKHPELRYAVRALAVHEPDLVRIDGELLVAGTRTPLALDATLRTVAVDAIELGCRTHVDRITLGVRGARGMVPRMVEVDVGVVLRRPTT